MKNLTKPKKRNKRKTLENKLDKFVRLVVLKRAGYKCEKCGRLMEKGLNVHHVFTRYNRAVRWLPENLVALCPNHHCQGKNSAHLRPAEFIEWFKETKGQEVYDYILRESGKVKKWTLKEMEEYVEELEGML